MNLRQLACFALVSCALPLAFAVPDRPGRRPPHRRAVVTLYEHAGFGGGSFTLYEGEEIDNFANVRFSNGVEVNDNISSIRIEGDAELQVFRDGRFRGGMLTIAHSISNLRDDGWNDVISSVRFAREREGRPPHVDKSDLEQADRMIRQAYRDILQREPDVFGLRTYRANILDDGWNDEQLRDVLRHSAEFRLVAERIITQAYRDVLGREPDAGGMRVYSDHLINHGMTESALRAALKNSDEYRRRQHRDHR